MNDDHKKKIGLANAKTLKGRKLSKSHIDNIRKATTKRWNDGTFTGMKGLKNPKLSELRKRTIGNLAPNWRGGKTKEREKIRKSAEYKLWRTAVFQRDNYTCIWCGQRGGRLNADHIKPFALFPELRLAIDNGRTLCIDCHKTTESYLNSYGKNQYSKGFILEE
jgi:hypothetical protein